MEPSLLTVIALSFLLTHEMDAVRRHEWQIFPLLARVRDDGHGYALFTALHVPLYALLLGALLLPDAPARPSVVVGLDIFCLVHVGLHALFTRHPRSQFNTPFSWALILGAGLAGGLDLLLRW